MIIAVKKFDITFILQHVYNKHHNIMSTFIAQLQKEPSQIVNILTNKLKTLSKKPKQYKIDKICKLMKKSNIDVNSIPNYNSIWNDVISHRLVKIAEILLMNGMKTEYGDQYILDMAIDKIDCRPIMPEMKKIIGMLLKHGAKFSDQTLDKAFHKKHYTGFNGLLLAKKFRDNTVIEMLFDSPNLRINKDSNILGFGGFPHVQS